MFIFVCLYTYTVMLPWYQYFMCGTWTLKIVPILSDPCSVAVLSFAYPYFTMINEYIVIPTVLNKLRFHQFIFCLWYYFADWRNSSPPLFFFLLLYLLLLVLPALLLLLPLLFFLPPPLLFLLLFWKPVINESPQLYLTSAYFHFLRKDTFYIDFHII